MQNVKLIPFKKEHVEVMDVRDHEKNVLGDGRLLPVLEKSIAVTGITDGRIIACGGVTPFGTGNADIWLIPSIWIPQYAPIFVKHLRKWLFKIREDLALVRMQSACLDDELHGNWMQFLSFEREGTMKKYFNDTDYALWGRTTWD